MISKRVSISASNDNYGALARYIADAGHGGEKCLMSWCEGMLGGEDYAEGIAETVDTQERNTRAAAKTYHLVISFRPEDEARLTPELCKTIEERFASALGYADHQRHCGIHKNTANLHMHVAYNMVHPEKYTHHKEFRDFWIRDKLCRKLEREYGLTVDNGRGQGAPERQPLGEKAALIEAHTGQQSFESYAKEQHSIILQALEAAKSWQETHEALARHGLEIKPHGNGLVIKDRHGKEAMKASALDRSLSLKKQEARFGAFAPPQGLDQIQEQRRYQAEPLHRSPERGKLFAEYQQGIEKRKTRLEWIKQQEDAALAAIRAEWAAKRREIERMMSMGKRNRRRLLQVARRHETEALATARQRLQEPRDTVRRDIPFTSWNGFLRNKAEHGNEVALAVLRSSKNAAEVEHSAPSMPGKDWSQHGRDQFAGRNAVKAAQAAAERAVLESEKLSSKGKTRLLAVLRMEQLAEEERRNGQAVEVSPVISGFQHTIDRKGTVIFTLPGGGRIMDTGRELFFSSQDSTTQNVAMSYARKKWGKSVRLEGNRLYRELDHIIDKRREIKNRKCGIGE